MVPFPVPGQRRRWWVRTAPAPVVPPASPGFLPAEGDDEHVRAPGSTPAGTHGLPGLVGPPPGDGVLGAPLTLSTASPADDIPVLLPRRPVPRPGAVPPPRSTPPRTHPSAPHASPGSPPPTGPLPPRPVLEGLPRGARPVGSTTPTGVVHAGGASPLVTAAPALGASLTRTPAGPGQPARPAATLPSHAQPAPLFTERRAARPDPAVQAVEMLVAELAATRGMLGELLAGHRSETALLREEVARLREEVHARPSSPLLGVTRAVLQAHNDELVQRSLRLGVAASAAFVATAQQVGLDDDGLVALQEWVGGGGRGVVVAPDAHQRLLLGVAALHHVVEQGRAVVVVAPRRQDVVDWSSTLRELLPATPVITGRHRADDGTGGGRVLVTTAHAYARDDLHAGAPAGLLVAVDAERFGAPTLAPALDARADWRLGLSGGYRRNDDGLVRLTDPYFDGGVVHVG